MKYVNVITMSGERRIAGVENGKWRTISVSEATLEGRENSVSPYGKQCPGYWMDGESVWDTKTGEEIPYIGELE